MNNIEANGSDIITWSRDTDDKYKVNKEIITDFRPYFYVQDSLGKFTSVFGEKLKKVYVRLPSDVPKVRTQYDKHYEADILYCSRYMIDKTDELKKELIRVCYLDIETESGPDAPQKYVNASNPENKILVIGVLDSFELKYKILCLSEPFEFDKCEIEFFDDEVKLLKKFCSYVRKNDFDLFSGYYIEKFDMMYIINRMKKLRMNMTLLSRDNVKTYIDDYERIHIWGRDIYDVYWGIRDLKSGERESWKLGDVSQEELGYGKLDYDGELWELWKKDRKKYCEYNYVDVKLLYDLDKKLGLISHHDEIRRISKCGWSNVFVTNMVNDCVLLQFCKGRYVLPSIIRREKTKFAGALTEVYDTGLFKNVLVFDYRSLYPTIMILHNISFETISTNFNDIPIGNGVYFSKDKLGIVPELLIMLNDRRLSYKKKMKEFDFDSDDYNMYNNIQVSYKIFSNSFYGLFGYVRSRVYNTKCAGSVTFKGKKIIGKTIEIAGKYDLKVLYAHTDSISFEVKKDMTEKELKELGEKLSKEIEKEVRKILPKNKLVEDKNITLDLEFESICKSAFFNEKVKNRNAKLIIYQDGKFLDKPKLKVTGFQSIRSDTPKLVQNLLNEVFMMILEEKEESEVLRVINKFKTKFMNEQFYIGDISIPMSIKVDVPGELVKGLSYHVKGAVNYNQRYDSNITRGDKVKVCYVRDSSIDVISFKEKFPSDLKVDYKKMWKRYISIFEDIFECMKWYSLKTGSSSLSQFSNKKMTNSNVTTGTGLFKFSKSK